MQTSYSRDFATAFDGMKVDIGFDYVESKPAQEAIDFGRGLVKAQGSDTVRPPMLNQLALALSGDLVSVNALSFGLSISGVVTSISEAFDTDQVTTMTNVKDAVEALDGITSATLSNSNRTITILGEDVYLDAITPTITGATAVTITETNSTVDSLVRGIALHEQRDVNGLGVGGYQANDTVSVLRRGKVHATVIATVEDGDAVYISTATATRGKLTNSASGNIAVPGAKFRSHATDGQLAIVEINAP